jgi:hypothetical protein
MLSFETIVNDLLTIVQSSKAFIAQFAGACVSEVIARGPARREIGFLIADHRRRPAPARVQIGICLDSRIDECEDPAPALKALDQRQTSPQANNQFRYAQIL